MFIQIALGLVTAATVSAQEMQGNCLRLLGSSACPGFQTAYLNPSNLSNAFPFFSDVNSVASFDSGAFRYFSDPNQYQTTKFQEQLGCTNASAATIRYSRTVLCSMWVNQKWSIECTALYDGQTAATSSKMVCQGTCLEYAFGEADIINNPQFCPGPDLTGGSRIGNVTKDYAQCTDWTSLATNNSDSCVLGSTNEGNCGYGSSSSQLCTFCNGSNPADCCYDSNTDVSFCGYALPARADRTSSSAAPSGTSASENRGNTVGSTGLSKGALAGIIVGSVLGGLLLLALLIGLCCCLRNRKSNLRNRDSGSSYPDSSMAPPPSTGIFARNPGAGVSEKGLLGPGASRTTVGNASTLFSHGHGGPGYGDKSPSPVLAPVAAGLPTGVGARANGVVLPRVRDENQAGTRWIVSGSEVAVLWPYQASLPDELELKPGMRIRVLRLYDDAWGTGQDFETGRQGAFPIVCVSENLNPSMTPSPPGSLDS